MLSISIIQSQILFLVHKQEGENCGLYNLGTANAGQCALGLECKHNRNIPDAPGKCTLSDKQEGENCGLYNLGRANAGQCAPGLECKHNRMIPDAPGKCDRSGKMFHQCEPVYFINNSDII